MGTITLAFCFVVVFFVSFSFSFFFCLLVAFLSLHVRAVAFLYLSIVSFCTTLPQIGFTHVRVADGVNSLLQLMGMCARLCRVAQQQ